MKVGTCTKCGVEDVPLARDTQWCETCVRLYEMGHRLWISTERVRQLEDQLIEAGRKIAALVRQKERQLDLLSKREGTNREQQKEIDRLENVNADLQRRLLEHTKAMGIITGRGDMMRGQDP